MEPTGNKELFSQRTEVKYLMPLAKALTVRDCLDELLSRDRYCTKGAYCVRSLYFDSVNNIDFAEKLSGVIDRKKVRLRTYNNDSSVCKLEIKQKNNDRQQKLSILLSEHDAGQLARGNYKILKNYFDTAETSIRAYTIMAQGLYRPVAQIAYDRIAYQYPMYDTRVTLDMNIRSSESNLDLFAPAVNYIPIMKDNVVLEIKYSGKLMGFLSDLLSQFHLTQGTYSKYCAGRRVYYDFNY